MTILINPRWALLGAIAAAAVLFGSAVLASNARAGTYIAWQCAAVHGGPGNNDVGNNNGGNATGGAGYTSRNDCWSGSVPNGFPYSFGHQAFQGAVTGAYKAFDVIAPSGTRFLSGSVEGNLFGIHGHEPLISVGNGSTLSTIASNNAAGGGGWVNYQWNAPYEFTTQLVVWMVCASGNGWCNDVGGYSTAYARNLFFNIQDYTAPGNGIGGSLTGGGWRNSGGSFAASGSDSGSGVYFVDHYINGGHISRSFTNCSLTTLFGGTVGTQLTPCSTTHSNSQSYGVGSFAQGANTITGCTSDFATDGNYNQSCQAATVRVDTVAPTMGDGGVNLAGGSEWRPTNDFDVSWSNPQQAHAPIDGAYYRITGSGGGYDSGAQFVSGADKQSLGDLAVPAAGEYTLKVWARDQAGNQSESNAQTTTLRYDPTVPPASRRNTTAGSAATISPTRPSGRRSPPGSLGPSGLEGYAVSVTQDPARTLRHRRKPERDLLGRRGQQPGDRRRIDDGAGEEPKATGTSTSPR